MEEQMKKPPILLKKLSRKESQPGKLVIGVLGTHIGVGVTHLCLLLANYLSEWLGKKVAYIECYPRKDIQHLQYIYEGSEKGMEKGYFHIHRVTYFKCVRPMEIAEVIGGSYDCIILDMGTEFTKNQNEFLRCDLKLVISSLVPWKQQELEKFLEHTKHVKQSEEWLYLIPFGQKEDIKQISKEMGRKFYSVPYEPDPFVLSAETIYFFQIFI
mgnify:CR=1 FL=1